MSRYDMFFMLCYVISFYVMLVEAAESLNGKSFMHSLQPLVSINFFADHYFPSH